MNKLLSFLTYVVIQALPTDRKTTQEPAIECETNDETDEDSGTSSTDDGDPNSTSTDKGKAKPNDYIETATSHDRYSAVLPQFEHKNERHCTEYGSPGPPVKYIQSDVSQYVTEQRKSFSMRPTGRVASETHSIGHGQNETGYRGERTATEVQEIVSWGTLSEDNLSVDARACALPKRRPKGAKTKAEKLTQTDEKQRDKGDEHHKTDQEKIQRLASMEDFVKQLVRTQISPQARIKFFDAAIVYEKEDYCAAMNFKEEVIMIVKSELNEEVRIELFDSEEFAQSKIIVVDDVLTKCSLVFVYLTVNIKSPELMFFIEEAIGMSRLGLNNMDIQTVTSRNDKQWVIKPIHTLPPRYRAYRVPTGLLSVNGIEWYNKDKPHTRQQICAVMHAAIQTRKEREIQGSISHLPRETIDQTFGRQNSDRHVQGINNASNPNFENTGQDKHDHFISHQSHDAMSFTQDSGHFHNSPFRSFTGGQNPIPVAENVYNRLQPTPRLQTNQVNTFNQSNWQSSANSFHCHSSVNHNNNPMFPQQDMTRIIPPGMRHSESVQSGRYQQMLSQTGQQYESLPTYQHQSSPFRGVFQSAGLQDRNEQPIGNEHSTQQGTYQGYTPTHNGNDNIYNHPNACMAPSQQSGFPGHPRRDQGYTSQQNTSGVSVHEYNWQRNSPVQSQIHGVPINRNYGHMYQQAPVRQHGFNVQQQFSHSQDEPLTRDAFPSEPRNFLSTERNDVPSSARLNVVSKVTGNLIVNPNLSTDDVEVDNYVPESNSQTKESTKSRKENNRHTRRQNYKEYDSEDSSSDSDFDIPKSKLKRVKQKVVNVVGCKIVQMGSRNKVKEHGSKYAEDIDESPAMKLKRNELEIKHRSESTESSPARVSVSTPFIDHQRRNLASAAESNILSTDNMSVGSSILRNLDTGLGEKYVADKSYISGILSGHSYERLLEPGVASGHSERRLHERGIELNHLSSVVSKQEHSNEGSVVSNVQDTGVNSELISSNQDSDKDSECPTSPDDNNLSDNDDYLFKSGACDGNTPKVAPFMFSQNKICGINMLKGSREYIKLQAQHIEQTKEESEID